MAKNIIRRTVSASVRDMLASLDEDILQADDVLLDDELAEEVTASRKRIKADEFIDEEDDSNEDFVSSRQGKRAFKKVAEDKTMYPGRVNQEDRPVTKMDQYDNYKEVEGWELQSKKTDWKKDSRDEIGFGIPKIASIYAASQQAVRLATLFLGDKVKENLIEAQARDFMRLGSRRLRESLERFNASANLYAEEVEETKEAATEEQLTEKADPKAVEQEAKKIEAPVATVVKAEEKAPEVKVEAAKAEEKAPEVKVEAAKVEEKAPVAVKEVKAEEKKDAPAAEEKVEEKEASKEVKADDIEMDMGLDLDEATIEASEEDDIFGDLTDEDSITNADEDEEIDSIFADEQMDDAYAEDDKKEVVSHKTPSKKAGIKKLGGNLPKASTKVASVDDLSGVWSDAPDVTSIF